MADTLQFGINDTVRLHTSGGKRKGGREGERKGREGSEGGGKRREGKGVREKRRKEEGGRGGVLGS